MDLNITDNMVNGLFYATLSSFYFTLTSRRRCHAPFVEAGAEMSDPGAEAVNPGPRCSG